MHARWVSVSFKKKPRRRSFAIPFFLNPPPFIIHHDRIRRVAHARSFRVSSY